MLRFIILYLETGYMTLKNVVVVRCKNAPIEIKKLLLHKIPCAVVPFSIFIIGPQIIEFFVLILILVIKKYLQL